MDVLGLLTAGAVVVLLTVLAGWLRSASRRSQEPDSVTEEQARENAAPLTTAILSALHPRKRNKK